ncbi:MAG: OmpH family outer membrane protein [Candidatus Obscuribacterales bacterium]|nr:OmpH family outer membrane protein [Candidatus Obscuribacterales bacterium]
MKRQFVIGIGLLLSTAFVAQVNHPLLAQESPVSVRIAYFNLGMVKANYPLAASSEILKAQAEAQLREEARSLNETLQKMKDDKKPESEIKDQIEISQTKITAKQQALGQLLQSQSQQVRMAIGQAVNIVAKEKGLDIVVDGQAIFAGGQKFLDNGVDVTRDVISKLQP